MSEGTTTRKISLRQRLIALDGLPTEDATPESIEGQLRTALLDENSMGQALADLAKGRPIRKGDIRGLFMLQLFHKGVGFEKLTDIIKDGLEAMLPGGKDPDSKERRQMLELTLRTVGVLGTDHKDSDSSILGDKGIRSEVTITEEVGLESLDDSELLKILMGERALREGEDPVAIDESDLFATVRTMGEGMVKSGQSDPENGRIIDGFTLVKAS